MPDNIIKGCLLASLIAAGSSASARVPRIDPAVQITGLGMFTCSTAQTTFNRDERVNWIMGYWSGLNSRARDQVGGKSDIRSIIGEVENTCRTEPSAHLADAVLSVYAKLAASGR